MISKEFIDLKKDAPDWGFMITMICMDQKPIVTLSQSLRHLISCLKEQLFSLPQQPFQKKIVFVPDLNLKNTLMRAFLADKNVQVVMGIECVELEQGMRRLFEWCLEKPVFFPSLHLLTLELETILETPNLAPPLAVEFLRYGKFGGPFLKKWPNSWQKKVWDQVFSKWNYPYQILDLPLKKPSIDASLFFFHVSFLPKLYHLFLDRISSYFPIHYYQFSPCAEFWSDTLTDFEKTGLLEKNPHLSLYLGESHSFLANFGKMGRKNMQVLEEEDFIFDEQFKVPSKTTHLASLQREMIQLKMEAKDKPKDDSIVLLPASSKLREVEILYTKLIEMDISPSEVQVFAPDMSVYAPLVAFVFGAEDSPYACTFYEPSNNPFLGALMQLLTLDRFEPKTVFSLLSNPYFFPLSKQEAQTLKDWMTQSGVKWGVDLTHRLSFLPTFIDQTNHGTWQKAFDILLDTLVWIPCASSDWDLPYLNFSEGETLAKGIWVIYSLRDDLDYLKGATLTGAEWTQALQVIVNRHFKWEEEGEQTLENVLHPLIKIETPFSFSSLQRYLSHFLKQKRRREQAPNLNGISFCSLHSGMILSSKTIVLLGMGEESFPRSYVPSSLNLLGNESDYYPIPPDEDRYLFLQAVMSAEERLWITYQNINEEDGKETFPSLLVQELDPKVEVHPTFPFHYSYFSSPGPHLNRHYQIAQTIYHPEKKLPFIPEYLYPTLLPSPKNSPLPSFQTLERFAKHPIRFYFQETLALYLQNDPTPGEEFFLSPIQRHKLLRKKTSLEEADHVGRLPLGRFKEVAKKKIKEEWSAIPSVQTTPYFLKQFQETILISEEGFPFLGKPTLEELIKIYPLYLAVCTELPLPLFALMGKTSLHLKGDPQSAFEAYLEYYHIACQTPSPLLPLFAPSLLQKEANAFAKALQHIPKDPYCQHVFRERSQYDSRVIFETWTPLLRQTFAPLLEMLP